MKILVTLMGSVGDVTRGMLIPSLIKRNFPNSELGWVVEPLCAPIVQMNKYIDSVFIFNRKKGMSDIPRLRRELRSFNADWSLDLQRHAKSGLFSFLSGARKRIGFHPRNSKELNWLFQTDFIPYRPDSVPKLEQYHLFIEKIGGRTNLGNDYSLNLPPLDSSLSEITTGESIGIVLGSAWETKDWPKEGYVALLKNLRERSRARIVLIGSPGQREFGDTLIAESNVSGIFNSAGKTKLSDLFTVISKCRFVIGPDSGPGHMSSAVGIPYISLFGPTDPVRTAPEGSLSLVVKSEVPCAPCYRKKCPGLEKVCMRLITPQMVMQKAEPFLI